MPIYEYRCSGCEHQFEELVSVSAAERQFPCPVCRKPGAERILSSFAVRISGGVQASSTGRSCGGCRRSSCATC